MKNKGKIKFFSYILLLFIFSSVFLIIIFPFTKMITYIINTHVTKYGYSFSAEDIDYVFPAGLDFEKIILTHNSKNIEYTAKKIIVKPVDFFKNFLNIFECNLENFVFHSRFGQVSLDRCTAKYFRKTKKISGIFEYVFLDKQSGWTDIYLKYLFGDMSPAIIQKELYFDAEFSGERIKIIRAVSTGILNFNLTADIFIRPAPDYSIKIEAKLSNEFINSHSVFCDKLSRLRRINLNRTIYISIKSSGDFSLKNMIIKN